MKISTTPSKEVLEYSVYKLNINGVWFYFEHIDYKKVTYTPMLYISAGELYEEGDIK